MSDWRDRLVQHDGRQSWLAARREFIGASEVAAVLGVEGAYGTPLSVWASKTGKTDLDDEVPEFIEWGNHLEPIIAKVYGERVERPVTTLNFATITAEDFPFIGISPDGWVGKFAKEGYEGKCSNAFRRNVWYEGVPLPYEVQCNQGMFVTGLDKWSIACLIGGNELVHRVVEYNAEFMNRAVPVLERFWNEHVLTDKPPMPGASDGDRKVIVGMFPNDRGSEATLDPRHSLLVEQLIEARKAKKDAESIINGIQNVTRLAMGEHALATFVGLGKFTHKTSKAGVRTLRFTEEK